MKFKNPLVFLAVALMFAAGCGGGKSIKIDGSSTVYPVSQNAASSYGRSVEKAAKVKVSESGSGGGFKKFARKEIDIADASRAITKPEDKACQEAGVSYVELPIAYDGLAVVVNPQNTWVDKMTVAELKKIWSPEAQKKVMKWSDVRPGWPDTPLKLYGAGTASGTFDYFTEAIVGKAKSSRGDYSQNENDNVLVQGVAGDKGGLGYFGLYYYMENKDKLKIVPIDDENDANGSGAIAPTDETVKNGTYQPLSRPLFIYVSTESAKRPEIEQFVNFYLTNIEKLVTDAKYVPLTTDIYDLVRKRFANRVTGSVFVNLESGVGIKLEDLLKKE